MFLTRFIMAGALAASLAAPAAAQSAAEDARFAQAQARFQNELQIFQQAFNRYQAARARGGYDQGGYDQGGYGDQNGYAQPPRVGYPQYGDDGRYPDEQSENGYDPSRYYRSGSQYQERVLASDDRVYSGSDGRYYCKRSDGTTGLIVGGAAGGILGNVIDGGHSRIVGTLLGGAAGALAGKAIDQNNSQIRCR